MSGYFGALMRSTGMAIGDRAPAMTADVPRGLELNVEHVPAATPAATPAPSPRIAPAPLPVAPVASLLNPPAPATHPTRSMDARVDEVPAVPVAEPSRSRATAERDSDEPRRPAPLVNQPKPDPGQALVKAAMRWVAADAQNVRTPAHVVTPPDPPLAIGDHVRAEATDRRPQRLELPTIEVAPPPTTTTSGPAPSKAVEVRVPAEVLPVPNRRTPPAPTLAPQPPLARDEVIEVSIGAINVRVDAPAAQTVARPAAPAPAPVTRRATSPIARSALSRRSLRRI
jgi:hypothetical protein